jgi:hypothetical protein
MFTLDNDWGLYYLITRLCLAGGADDEQVVGSPVLPPRHDSQPTEMESD